jgi:hypothetical protein
VYVNPISYLAPLCPPLINSYQKLNPDARLDNFEMPKAFILVIAKAINSRYGNPDACLRTMKQYWKNTTIGLDWEEETVNPKIVVHHKHEFLCYPCPTET